MSILYDIDRHCFVLKITIPADIALQVGRRTHEHNVWGHYRVCEFESLGWPTKTTNSPSDKTLN